MKVKLHCGRMDHGGCGLQATVEGGRLTSIAPDPSDPLSLGHICPKARALAELHNHPQRLTRPLKRVGEKGEGRFEPIGWDRALKMAAEAFNRVKADHGGRAVAFCQGAPKGLEHFVLIRLANAFGSPNVVGPQNVCHMPREIAGMLTCGFFPVVDYENPQETLVVWGSNLTATNEEGVISSRLIRNLSRRRPKLIVIDPRKTELARRADIWLPIHPGTDLALALGFIQVIIAEKLYDADFVEQYTAGFDELARAAAPFTPEETARVTGLHPPDILAAARAFGAARPGAIQWGNGIEQTHHNLDTARALICLMALGGNLDAPGGNIAATPPPAARLGEFVRADLAPDRRKNMLSAAHGPAPGFVIVPPELFKRAVVDGDPYPVKAAYIQVSNPVVAWSDSVGTVEALKKLDFLAVTETFLSPTAALADLVLPAATQGEYNDLGHYGLAHGFVLPRPKLVDPPGKAKSNLWILNQLAAAMGLGQYFWENEEGVIQAALAPSGLGFDDLTAAGWLKGETRYYKYKDKGFKTQTGKVNLALPGAPDWGGAVAPTFTGPPADPDPEYPLTLIAHKSRWFFCSDHRYLKALRDREPLPPVQVHPETARLANVADGDPVFVETPQGRIRLYARVTPYIKPRVLSAPHGWWLPEKGPADPASWRDSAFNVLTSSADLNRAMGTPNLRAIPARLTLAPEEPE
jgi:anaerobic selenocysteine-containing dehydrogenase